MRAANALELHFVNSIKARGPLSVASWMRDCLTHPRFGYYTRQAEVLGRAGDFVTSVELSGLFCGMVGVWARQAWQQLGRPPVVRLAELGPGSGRLMAAVARAVAKDGVRTTVHLVEASSVLRGQQQAALEGLTEGLLWHETVGELASEEPVPTLALAHEFFDALPIYRFQCTADRGWCEELIDITPTTVSSLPLRLVLSPGSTPPAQMLLPKEPLVTGKRIEVSAEALGAMAQLSAALAAGGGAALLIDYGSFGPAASSLRGIAKHAFVDPLAYPAGECDLSVDVDFRSLHGVAREGGLHASSCLTHRDFLRRLGIEVLLVSQVERAQSESEAEALISEYNRVVDEMGEVYKAMVVSSCPAVVADYA
jgi:NADH dehydrogenase [ubiquinone] 1 alpha subcomplex assembly factor 7